MMDFKGYGVAEVLMAYFEFWHWAGFWAGFIGCWVSLQMVLICHLVLSHRPSNPGVSLQERRIFSGTLWDNHVKC